MDRPFLPSASRLCLGFAAAILVALSQVAIPKLVGLIVDSALVGSRQAYLATLSLGLAAAAVGVAVGRVGHRFTFGLEEDRILRRLQRALLSGLYDHNFQRARRWRPGKLQARLIQDAANVARVAPAIAGASMLAATELLAIFGLLIYEYGRLSWVAFALVPVFLALPVLIRKRQRVASHQLFSANEEVAAELHQAVQGLHEIKALGRQRWMLEALEREFAQRRAALTRFITVDSLHWLTYVLSFAVGALLYWIGGRRVGAGALSLGELVTLVALMSYLDGPLSLFSRIGQEYQTVKASMDRLRPLLVKGGPTWSHPHVETASRPPGKACTVSFREVTFRYDDSPSDVLEQVTFDVSAGWKVVIVGPSGAGKSTLLHLLLRLDRPTRGTILLDGLDLWKYPEEELRFRIGFAAQSSFIFAGSVEDNIRLGRRDPPFQDVIAAASAANAHLFIEGLPEGYQTTLRDAGGGLSGGELRRLAIARALFGSPDLVVFDEPTASLDPVAQTETQAGIRKGTSGRTCFMASHRMADCLDADLILVLVGGRLVAQGTHRELTRTCPTYAHLLDAHARYEQEQMA